MGTEAQAAGSTASDVTNAHRMKHELRLLLLASIEKLSTIVPVTSNLKVIDFEAFKSALVRVGRATSRVQMLIE